MPAIKAEVRILNGYRVILMPEHTRAMTSDNWNGYVYEHIVFAEESLGRPLTDKEVVHHLDGNRANNLYENLLVLENSQHTRLHMWLKKIEYKYKENQEKEYDKTCEYCGKTIQGGRKKYCCKECYSIGARKTDRPTVFQLRQDINSMPWVAIGKKYGVTDNAVRKWARAYGLI